MTAGSSSTNIEAAGSVLQLASCNERFPDMRAHRPDSARAGISRLLGTAKRTGANALVDALGTPEGAAFFSFLFGNSPHLSGLLMRDLVLTEALTTQPPDLIAQRIRRELTDADSEMGRDELMQFLRLQRSRVAVIAAVYDCFGLWGVMQCAELLSDMADQAVRLAVSHLLLKAVASGDLAPPEEEGRWGYFALAMGKHGSRELNYSSDIDLIVIYDPERIRYRGRKTEREHFARLTRRMVDILETRDVGGYVFRTDLRLRPDAASTPVAISRDFALDYYHSKGRTWERAALIKARAVAGDLQAGADFLQGVSSFIWDEGLDFSSVEEIRSMSEQIHDFHGHGTIKLPGQNLKLGRGGIREIEFFVHMHQLAYGGRRRQLRGAQVLPMLATLEREHHVMPREAETLSDAYLLLRRVEHRLQMVNDSQTQTLPQSDEGLDHIATFMNLPSREDLGALIGPASAAVHALYCTRFNVPEREQDIAEAILAGPAGSPDVLGRLQAAGFREAQAALDTLRGWAEGRYASIASEHARNLVRDFLHDVVDALGKTPAPDRALARLDRFLAVLPEDVPLFSMLRANTWLANLIAVVMGSAPRIADRLGDNPRLLQGVLDPSFFLPVPGRKALFEELAERLDGEGNLDRRVERIVGWADDRAFQVGVQTLQHLISLEEASASRSHIADIVVEALLWEVLEDVPRRHDNAPASGHAVVALGDLGASDMIFGSSLQLMLVADLNKGAQSTDRRHVAEAQGFYADVAERLSAALGRLTVSGSLQEVNVAMANLASFRGGSPLAQLFSAGLATGGRASGLMALARARVLFGDSVVAQQVKMEIQRILTAPRDTGRLHQDLMEIRERLVSERRTDDPFDLQHVRGGLLDLEWVTRHLQLRHAHEVPAVLASSVAASFDALGEAGILGQDETGFLVDAFRLQRTVQAFLQLTWSEGASVGEAPAALKVRLANALEFDGFEALETRLLQTQQEVRDIYRRLVAEQ